MPPKTVLPLPSYTRRRWNRKSNAWGYYFEPPTRARINGCPVHAEALGTDYRAAVERVETILLKAFDSWRTAGASDLVPSAIPPKGTFDWLVTEFKSSRQYRDIDPATQRTYDQGLALVSKYILKNGTTFGRLPVTSIDPGVADRMYEALKTVQLDDGTIRERPAYAAAAMRSCRRAWKVAHRLHSTIVPDANPFTKMGIKSTARKETPTATYEELMKFVSQADKDGFPSLGTAALITWEWAQRGEHIFGSFEAAHYRPKERPNTVRVVHPKTGEEAWIPLYDETGAALFPELMHRLDRIKAERVSGLMIVRDWPDRNRKIRLPWITERGGLDFVRHSVKKIILAAQLRSELSFTSFRHGGITEASDSDLTEEEIRAVTRHKTLAVLPRYSKRTMKKVAAGAIKRRAGRAKNGSLSE
ncbi:hypothetical protein [Pseudochelatococcus sp. G4_1912]|uniref:hypothetical protein n=1 Tax=Pseudochelatococcus sp. G4_1912 TaxID=3114288 RepID=UPI0039C5DF49